MKHSTLTQVAKIAGAQAAPKVVAYLSDPETVDVLQKVGLERRMDGMIIYEGGISAALEETTSLMLPDILIVDIGESVTAVADVSALATVSRGATRLIVVGEVNDVHLFRDLLSAGARDYLVKPVDPNQLATAILDSSPQQAHVKTEEKQSHVIVCLGARGGVGATTTSVGLSWMIAQERKQKVALVDFDLQFGTVALSLNVGVGRGLREALEQPARIDSLFIERAAEKVAENLFVLGSEEPLDEEVAIDITAPSRLLHELRERFEYVVVDLPRGASLMHRQVLVEATHIVVLVEMTLPGIRDAIRLNAMIQDCAPGAETIFVAVERSQARGHRISVKDFEKSVGCAVSLTLPWDASAAQAAAGQAKAVPAVAKNSKLSNGQHELLIKVAGAKPAVKGHFWKKLIGGKTAE